ncbi:hypothetical protein SCLCIDRAFT_676870 [Scleroderma citrinum Foug A]|uniref:Uncharacterized protein n=1 Tax=Scleroderma citrinum Foug A TaxID=1036808 RepID=A0A0C2ZQW5_9AGAM|nr:hypothetical protein SCLCIDRAFT_676870 [Scleroderma citrinum Foug A]
MTPAIYLIHKAKSVVVVIAFDDMLDHSTVLAWSCLSHRGRRLISVHTAKKVDALAYRHVRWSITRLHIVCAIEHRLVVKLVIKRTDHACSLTRSRQRCMCCMCVSPHLSRVHIQNTRCTAPDAAITRGYAQSCILQMDENRWRCHDNRTTSEWQSSCVQQPHRNAESRAPLYCTIGPAASARCYCQSTNVSSKIKL